MSRSSSRISSPSATRSSLTARLRATVSLRRRRRYASPMVPSRTPPPPTSSTVWVRSRPPPSPLASRVPTRRTKSTRVAARPSALCARKAWVAMRGTSPCSKAGSLLPARNWPPTTTAYVSFSPTALATALSTSSASPPTSRRAAPGSTATYTSPSPRATSRRMRSASAAVIVGFASGCTNTKSFSKAAAVTEITS